MTKEKGIPQIRFSGFTDTWEQREVSNVAMISTGGTPSTAINEYWNPKQVPWLSSGEVHKKYITYTDDKISNEGLNHSSARMIKQNSVLIALAGQGKTRGTVAINRISLSTNQSIAAMTFAPDICPEFVFSNLESRYDELRKVSSGDGTRGGLNKQLVSEIQIPYTSLNEQRKIGQFFTHLDRLITLHQRKYDKLTKVKKAMLEKMFPKNGSLYPEIRFKGFTDAWEQRELGECFSERVESMPDGELISVTINDGIKKFSELGRHDNSNDDKSKYKKVCIGDIAYNSMRMWQGASGYSPYEGIVSPAYTVLSPNSNIYSKCVAYQFKLPQTIHIFQINSQGITSDNWNLKYPALSKIKINVSRSLEEQRLIAEFFTHLDRLITLHQRKLEKLKNIKKACLEKMFV